VTYQNAATDKDSSAAKWATVTRQNVVANQYPVANEDAITDQYAVTNQNTVTDQNTRAVDLLIFCDQVAPSSECVSDIDSLSPRKALSSNSSLRCWRRSRQQWRAEWRTVIEISTNQASQSNCALDIDLTCTLLERVKPRERLSGVHQDCLDQIGRQVWIDLQ